MLNLCFIFLFLISSEWYCWRCQERMSLRDTMYIKAVLYWLLLFYFIYGEYLTSVESTTWETIKSWRRIYRSNRTYSKGSSKHNWTRHNFDKIIGRSTKPTHTIDIRCLDGCISHIYTRRRHKTRKLNRTNKWVSQQHAL